MNSRDIKRNDLSEEWSNADCNAPRNTEYLSLVAELGASMKSASIDLLRVARGAKVLEVGCGLGDDAAAIAARIAPDGSVIGIDNSKSLIAEAEKRVAGRKLPLSFQVADAHALPFVDATFDAVRVDRVLQHLEDPVRAFAEMVRVTRCGGRVVALEPDWYTATISGGDLAIAEAVRTCCARQRVRNGSIGRKLRDLFAATNCDDINVEPRVFWTSDLETADKVMSLQESLQLVVGEKIADASAAKTWWNALSESNAAGGLYCSVNIIIVGGTVRRP